MKLREIQQSDLAAIYDWWKARGVLMNDHMTAPVGFIVPDVCAAWLTICDWACVISWPVSNPKAAPRAVHRGFCAMLAEAKEFAESSDLVLVSMSNARSLKRLYRENGMVECEKGCSVFVHNARCGEEHGN